MPTPHDASRIAANWPPYLTTRRAIAYTGLSRATINRAVAAGVLTIHGRPGGGERVFRREELDRWLASGLDAPAPRTPTPAAVLRRRLADSGNADALARIDEIAHGGRR